MFPQFEEVDKAMEGFQEVPRSLILEMETRVQLASFVILLPRMDETVIHSGSEEVGIADGYERLRSENFVQVRFAFCLRDNCSKDLHSEYDSNLQANSVLAKDPDSASRLR